MMRKALEWLRSYWFPVALVVAICAFAIAKVLPDRHSATSPRALGTIEHPAPLSEHFAGLGLVEFDTSTDQWRYARIHRVMEAPLADGYSDGRCFITFGSIDGGYLVSPSDEWQLALVFAADGVVAAAGDADLVCDAGAVEAAAEFAGYSRLGRLPFDQAVAMTFDQNRELRNLEKSRDYVAVTYLPGDLEPDSVVLTRRSPEAGSAIPSDSAIYTFRLSDLRLDYEHTGVDAWDELFGFEPVAGPTPTDGPSDGSE